MYKKKCIFGETFSLTSCSRRCYPLLFVVRAVLCSSGLARHLSLCCNSRHLDFTSSYRDEMLLSHSVKTRTAPSNSFGGQIFSQCCSASVCPCSLVSFVLTCSGFIAMHFGVYFLHWFDAFVVFRFFHTVRRPFVTLSREWTTS